LKKIIFILTLLLSTSLQTSALEIHDYNTVIQIIQTSASASGTFELDKLLRKIIENYSAQTEDTTLNKNVTAVLWYENWNPRARIWLKNTDAESLFRTLVTNQDYHDALKFDGNVDLELEIVTGSNPSIEGKLKMTNVSLWWENGEFAMLGLNGDMPFRRAMDPRWNQEPIESIKKTSIHIDTMVWHNRYVAHSFEANASYENKILRFEQISLDFLGGKGIGSMVIDHRGNDIRMVAAVKFGNVNLMKLPEILPGLPYFARVTLASVEGNVVLSYKSPNLLDLSGDISSVSPGVIELSPMMRESAREFLDSRVVQFQKLNIKLGRGNNYMPEASITFYRKTAQPLLDILNGVSFNPVIFNIKFPIIPFVQELSEAR